MQERELSRELEKMRVEQQQWRDDYLQREHHWSWQRYFWCFIAGAAVMSALFSLLMYFK